MAILFWFYKKPEICINRLKLIKKYNPDLKIFGIFGGDRSKSEQFKKTLGKYLDDFYTSPFKDPDWKWIHGDLMILDWYLKRGKFKKWDSITVLQWDTLIFDSIKNQFPKIKVNQIFLSGLKPLGKITELAWYWTSPRSKERKNYLKFLRLVKNKYNYTSKPLCSLFILQVFPRIFFDMYSKIDDREIGMLEYKTPIYAKIFKIPFYKKDFGVCWFGKSSLYPLNAIPKKINKAYIIKELNKKSGWRIFHPYYNEW